MVLNEVTLVTTTKQTISERDEKRKNFLFEKLFPVVYFSFITTVGVLSGFGYAFVATKKREQVPDNEAEAAALLNNERVYRDGNRLALRALTRATIYSLTGVIGFSSFLWFMSGAKNFQEFRYWMGSWLPKISSKNQNQERTEFKNLTELIQYIIDEDEKKKQQKKLLQKQEQS
ncbi:unnamed protein product [Didymodactylos carnosus]|uniref:Transmembrane protein 242 n=1 Tax=Didymodactylos carnosus TaxID=1234261 RepID=A0A813U5K5_9BILA|nr:unnamed protein product [Didymodactylos carnosus]CAF0823012.1 unnamed protein product [Didymodactylos carnosus]CAF3504647.1 unnamed protein product [Didymodactylos carnosus]CAF3609580.1 unnamed protein product [Didymodactylos carnosus]